MRKSLTAFIIKYRKIIYPMVIIVSVMLTVYVACSIDSREKLEKLQAETLVSDFDATIMPINAEKGGDFRTVVPLSANQDEKIEALVKTYYEAAALGDIGTVKSICNGLSKQEELRILYNADYISSYDDIAIYTKLGFDENEYVCWVYYKLKLQVFDLKIPGYKAFLVGMNDDGNYVIDFADYNEEQTEYIREISAQDDVAEFHNKVNVEYTELINMYPSIKAYLVDMNTTVNSFVAAAIAKETVTVTASVPEVEVPNNTDENKFRKTLSAVNLRVSDSEKSESVLTISAGTVIEITEEQPNGWTLLTYNKKTGYVLSAYLTVYEPLDVNKSIGTVRVTGNLVNIRANAGTAYKSLGTVSMGTELSYIGTEGNWYIVNYNGAVGYISASYAIEVK